MTNAPEGAFKIPNFIDQLELAKFGYSELFNSIMRSDII